MQILTVVIGIIFVLLLLSLLATTLMELLSSLFSLRARNLVKALRNMLASQDPDETLVKEFRANSLYRHLTQRYGRRGQGFAAPSYMNSETFQSILFEVILKGAPESQLPERIAALPDADLRNVLQQFYRETNGQPELFRLQVQNWYNNVMDRAAGWYKRYVQKILLFMGIGIALLFNADTVALYDRLSNDPETLATIADAAEQYVRARENYSDGYVPPAPRPPARELNPDDYPDYNGEYNLPPDPDLDQSGPGNNPNYGRDYEVRTPVPADYGAYNFAGDEMRDRDFRASLEDLKGLLNNEIAEVRRPLGLGWEGISLRSLSTYEVITKLLGFILTALAISLGAPFWFDLLKKLVNIRSAGARPYEER